MIKLQNDFTTPEQSKRLLELGMPADSANKAYWINIADEISYIDIPNNTTYTEFSKSIMRVLGHNYFPSWTIGRLIDVLEKSWNSALPVYCDIIGENDKVLYVIETIQHFANQSMLDFSKLEKKK